MAGLDQEKVKNEKEIDPRFLSIVLDKNVQKQRLEAKDRSKLELFERGLANELATSDTIDKSVEKIVKMALACEFGAELVMKPGAQKMISVISRGILSDRELRRSALIIADRFSSSEKKQVVVIRGKTKING